MRRNEEEKLEAFSTWQVRRSEFDNMLFQAARDGGTEFIDAKAETPILNEDGSVGGVRVVDRGGVTRDVKAKVVIDASGRKTWLANQGVTGPKVRDKYDNQIAIFSHLKGAIRDPGEATGNTIIFYQKFLHWGWFIPLDDEVVSVGIVTPSKYFRSMGESVDDFYRRELRELNPELASRVEDAELIEEVRAATNYSYMVDEFTGPGFMCVGDSHRFIDPIFSFGLFLTIYDAKSAAEAVADHLQGCSPAGPNPFLNFQRTSSQGLSVFQDLIDGFWGNPLAFGYMTHFTSHWEGIIDIFAGRVFRDSPSDAQLALKKVIATSTMWAKTETGLLAGAGVRSDDRDPPLEALLAGVTPG
jgi:FADH2-dependent halogenase